MKITHWLKRNFYRRRGNFARKELLVSAAALCILTLPCVFRLYAVAGSSMEPTYHEGDIVLTERITTLFGVWRGEVIVMRNPHDHSVTEIKRVAGLPNEEVNLGENSVTVTLDGKARTFGPPVGLPGTGFFHIQLGPEDYLVLGDNRARSEDSRTFGAVQKPDVYGHVILKLYAND